MQVVEAGGVSVVLNLGGALGKGSVWDEPDADVARWKAEKIEEAVLAAIALEREACARIADRYVADNASGESPETAAVWKAAGEIASEIRARGTS